MSPRKPLVWSEGLVKGARIFVEDSESPYAGQYGEIVEVRDLRSSPRNTDTDTHTHARARARAQRGRHGDTSKRPFSQPLRLLLSDLLPFSLRPSAPPCHTQVSQSTVKIMCDEQFHGDRPRVVRMASVVLANHPGLPKQNPRTPRAPQAARTVGAR